MRLPVGTAVRLSSRGKEKWANTLSNPHNAVGIIKYFYEEDYEHGLAEFESGHLEEENYFPFSVEWDNGRPNVYRYGDLEPLVDLSHKNLEDYL